MTLLQLKKIDCIMYYVEELEKAMKFYEDVLVLRKGFKDQEEETVVLIFPERDS